MRPERMLALLSALAAACVFPTDEPTGVELSWRFYEGNGVDGKDAQRLRTCVGVGIDTLTFALVDEGNPDRRGTFEFGCSVGYQTPDQYQTEASDAFIPLHGGTYDVDVVARGPDREQDVSMRTADVQSKGSTSESLDLGLDPVDWSFDLEGLGACQQLGLVLRYADPANDLAQPPMDDNGNVPNVVYRKGLTTDEGLSLGGDSVVCSGDIAGLHTVSQLDIGAYVLENHGRRDGLRPTHRHRPRRLHGGRPGLAPRPCQPRMRRLEAELES